MHMLQNTFLIVFHEFRMEIARAIFFRRPVVLADEATALLDHVLSRKIYNTILVDSYLLTFLQDNIK